MHMCICRECKRTQGVSTTDLVGRMLLLSRPSESVSAQAVLSKDVVDLSKGHTASSPWTGVSHFLPTSQRIIQFAEGREPRPGDRIVYMPGAFDLFHVGHVDALEMAKKMGDFLIVGVWPDDVSRRFKGQHFPIMNLHERVLSVLACKARRGGLFACYVEPRVLAQMEMRLRMAHLKEEIL